MVLTVRDYNAILINPATIGVDYTLNTTNPLDTSVTRIFPPTAQSIPFDFFLKSDDTAEGTEGFLASATSVTPGEGFPIFQPPTSARLAFATAAITIRDNDSKFSIIIIIIFF